jgi:hypothetical protein
MRPSSVYAKRFCPVGDPCDVLALLHGSHRVGCQLAMILLSQQRLDARRIAELLGCDARTCAAGSTATTTRALPGLATGPDPAGPAWAALASASASAGCWTSPRRGRSAGCGSGLVARDVAADPAPARR